ncbi:MAG: hypothetical protein ABI833_20195 [Acidobacteriota bacterium]
MSSRQKRKIDRTNGRKSAGAKSPAGLHASAQNALRHGLTAKTLVLSNESQSKFEELMEGFLRKFNPADEVELELVTEMVAARWRLRRVWLIQTAALDLQMDRMEPEIAEQFEVITQPTRLSLAFTTMANSEKSLELLLRYETTYSRAFDRALKALEKLQRSRLNSTREEELRNEPIPLIPAALTQVKPSTAHENAAENAPKTTANDSFRPLSPLETDGETPHPGPASNP